MARRDFLESRLAREFDQRLFMRAPAISVHQHDRDRANSARVRRAQPRQRGVAVERCEHFAIGIDALVDLEHFGGQRLGLDDPAGEDVGPLLRPDRQRVAEAARDAQQHRLALAFEQRVGRDGGADADIGRGQRPLAYPGQPPDRLDRGVFVLRGIVRQQLGGGQRAVGIARDDIGEGAAAVDPEMPARFRHGAVLVRIGRAR